MTRISRALTTALVIVGGLFFSCVPLTADAAGSSAHNAETCSHACPDARPCSGGHYTADADCDGTPNWRDATVNSEDGARKATGDDYYVAKDIFFHTFNILILVGLVVFFVRRPLSDFLSARALKIRTEIRDSQEERDQAIGRREDVAARLESIEGEIAGIAADAAADAKNQQEQLLLRAQKEAEHIAQRAERNIRDEVDRAKDTLRREAIELAVDLAKTKLTEKVSSDDQRRLARDILDAIEDKEGASDV
jgi:F-type H+-transporting ATPase subunit b